MWRVSHVVCSPAAIHVVAHVCNLERYHRSQSAEAAGLVAALASLGDASNESYLNPIRTFHTVSSCMRLPFAPAKRFLF